MGKFALCTLKIFALLMCITISIPIAASEPDTKAPKEMSPAESMSAELSATKEALMRGDYDGVTGHADNMRFIAKHTDEALPKELADIETLAHNMRVEELIADAETSYLKGSHDDAIFKFSRAVALMKKLNVKPSKRAILLARRINSGLLPPLYIFEGIFPPQRRL